MDKDRIAAIAARAEKIKMNRAEYLWICCGIKPPPLPDEPLAVDPNVDPEHLQVHLHLVNCTAPATRQRL